ncbi:Spy/CpxP family protein refolding chaperone [Psychromonas sp. KJ10-10]|uniref:Spy/CpxP family protein refolding chaperone n=1 Tax=Psychromonas sp. KJ10-10 TaxID=3391823 RepID=UPI0039B4422D
MNNKHISAIILATTLSFGASSFAMAEGQQGMKNGQTADQTTCDVKSGEMKKGKHHGHKYGKKDHGKKQGKQSRGNKQDMGFAKLDLTDTQKQAMRDIMKTAKEANKASQTAHRDAMNALMTNETFDAEQATKLISEQRVQKSEQRLAMMKAKHDMYQLLTDDQKAKHDELKTQRQNRSSN